MVRDLTDDDNQAANEPPLDAVMDGDEVPDFVQFRGRQTSVVVDDFNLLFTTEDRNGRVAHKPLPVVGEDELTAGDVPADAVVAPVAAELVRSNNLFGFGVACEACGEVFRTTKALDGHQSSHPDDAGETEGEQ